MATIGMVLESEYPPDIRIAKEARALEAAGHDVHLLALDHAARPRRERVGPLTVHRVRIPRVLHRKLHPTLGRLPLYRARWRGFVRAFMERVAPDVLTVHDLPLAWSVLAAAKRTPVVLDLHESFPAAIESWGLARGFFGRFLYDLDAWRRYERWALARAAGVVVVVEESQNRVLELGAEASRVVVVSNTEDPSFAGGVARAPLDAPPPISLLYVGGFGPHRGLDTAIDAMTHLGAGDASLRLVGDGRIRPALVDRVRAAGVEDRVSIERWISLEAVPAEIARAHVGLVPHAKSEHTETTIPHKLFQYMMLGRPVVVSDCAPLARVVEESGAGEVFASGDAAALARACRRLLPPERRVRAGLAAERAARGPLAWSHDAERLVAFYDAILA